ncbi:MAG: polynucleotide adenylyltransferase PcnB [Kiritimatiellaeota bacterium]|nr:polynucleotide adenylyltransferase PcnB [Kiritimatiellota bacterium]
MKEYPKPIVCPREKHCVSRKNIDPDALSVLYRLSNSGFVAYLVGGGVRDILLGRAPKDFDVATNAHPGQIRRLFRNAFLIGRRFRLALIKFGDKQIETSTFRRQPEQEEVGDEGRVGALYQEEDNYFGSPADDAWRRDFTVNGLFYDIQTFAVIDYVGGLKDLQKKVLRCIGDPNIRFREDPVRMMRAVRFAARLDFKIHKESVKAIEQHYPEITQASKPRLYEETMKLFGYGTAQEAFRQLWTTRLTQAMLPVLHDFIQNSGKKRSILWEYLRRFDEHAEETAAADTATRVAVLLCPLYLERMNRLQKHGVHVSADTEAEHTVMEAFSDAFVANTWRIPKAVAYGAASMLAAQRHFDERDPAMRRSRVFAHDWFAGALLLYTIRMRVTKGDEKDVALWHDAYADFLSRPQPPPDLDADPNADPNADLGHRRRPRYRRHRRRGRGGRDHGGERSHDFHNDKPE